MTMYDTQYVRLLVIHNYDFQETVLRHTDTQAKASFKRSALKALTI